MFGGGWGGGKAQAAGVVHAHIFPGMAVGAMVKRKVGWPLLTTVQGGDLGDYPETTGAGKGILRPLIKWSLKQADVVHAVSEYLAGKAKRLGAKKVVVVPNGVDVKMFRLGDRLGLRKKYDFLMDDKIVVSHSRLTPKNGMDVLIRAFALVRQKGAVRNLKLLIIGEGYQRKELEILIGKLGLGGAVVLMGEKPHEEIPGYLRLADVFCRPARDEGFGISFIEAMACGLPVVGTRVGGIPEIVEEGKTGWLVERGDVRGVAEAMVKLVTDKGLRVKWGREGRRVVERKFAWGRVMGEMEKVYREVGSQAVEV